MSGSTQLIHNGFGSYHVFGNSSLVLGASAYAYTNDSYSSINLAATPFVYFQPAKWFSIKSSYLFNNGSNFIEDNGYLVNNSSDLTKGRFSLLANFRIGKHLSLYGLYQLESKTESTQQFNYKYNIFVGGIRFTP